MPKKQNKKRALHVDDEDDVRAVVKTILEKEGFEVVGADSGKKALQELKPNGFDLILLDVMMPDMSGWELFTSITKLKPEYSVIFLTVLESSEEKLKQLKEYGIKDYITKPFDRDDFVARIRKALQ